MSRRMALHVTKLCCLVLLCTVGYNEFLCYWLHHRSWPRLPAGASGPDSAVVLLVADPQILGLEHEPAGPLGALRRWDGDRYLRTAFRWALSAYSPPTVVFLGDLMDEASEASPEQLETYAARFNSIYPPGAGRRMIYLPGDNDIGGESADPVTLAKIDQFERHFGPSAPVYPVTEWLDIVPVSRLTEHGVYNLTQKPSHLSPSKTVLAVSHLPVLPLNGRFAERVMDLVRPDMVFSAHDHHGYLFTGNRQSGKLDRDVEPFHKSDLAAPFTLQTRAGPGGALSEQVCEVVVPTCSYRMGVQEMGLGLAVVGRGGSLYYANLWLPGRFGALYTYAASLVIVISILGVRKLLELRRRWRRKEIQQTWKK